MANNELRTSWASAIAPLPTPTTRRRSWLRLLSCFDAMIRVNSTRRI